MYWAGTGQEKAAAIPAHLPAQSGKPWPEWQCCGTAWRDVAGTPPALQFHMQQAQDLAALICSACPCVPPQLSLLCLTYHCSVHVSHSPVVLWIFLWEQTLLFLHSLLDQKLYFWWYFWWKSGFLYLSTTVHLLNRRLQSSQFATTANFLLARQKEDVWLWKLYQALCFTVGLIAKGIC